MTILHKSAVVAGVEDTTLQLYNLLVLLVLVVSRKKFNLQKQPVKRGCPWACLAVVGLEMITCAPHTSQLQ